MNITLTISGRDFSPRLSTYNVTKETAYQTSVTTMGGVEHVAGVLSRDIVTFSLWPSQDAVADDDYAALRPRIVSVTFTNPFTNANSTKQMRVTSDLSQVFGIVSANGHIYYRGGEISLRALRCD